MLNSSLSLVFDIAIATVIAYRNLDLKSFYRSLRIYLCSGVFISLWGLMQFIFYFLKLPYPAFIFNNSSTYNALGYLANLESGDIIKMSSVALESSFLCRVLAGMLAISVVSARGRTHIFQGRTEYLVSGLLFITILLATSSTGYVGVAVLLVMLLFIPSSSKMRNWKTRLLVLVIFTTMVISYFLISIVNSTLNTQLLNKNATGSAVERAVIIYNDLQYFLKYPVLGVGWNCVPTHDVIIGMLATCGLVGLFAFLLLIGTILYKLKQNIYIPAMQDTGDNPSIMMLLCLSVTCAVYVISGEITVPDFWIILGLSIAAVGIGHNLRHTMQAN
jgi:O-antigen ligase